MDRYDEQILPTARDCGFFCARMLTKKQEDFVFAYLETGNATEAYRRSYSTANMKPETINRQAKEMMDHPKISARIAQERKEARQAVKITLKDHLETLQSLRDKAQEAGQFSAAVKAEEQRGKASGIYTAAEEDEKEIRLMGRDDILAELKQIQETLARYGQSGS